MSSLMMKLTKLGDVQLPMDLSLKMGIFNKSIDENSFYNELSKMSPCTLYLEAKELIFHPKSRRAVKHEKKPYSSRAPRPQNAFLIYRRNFNAKLKNEGKKLKNDEIGDYSRAAAKEWHENPQIHWYFEILENLAKRVHNQEYKDFKFSPQKRGKNKSNTVNNKQTKKFSESMCFDFQGIFNHNDVPEEVVVNQETTEFSEFFDFDYYYSQLQCFP